MKFLKTIFFSITALSLLFSTACLPAGQESKSGRTITVYGFSIMKEALEKEIYPAFAAKWKREKGEDINFVSSFAGSETVTNQILQGAPADLAILSIERDVERLTAGGVVTKDWRTAPHKSIINKTPFIILVRRGNPKNLQDFPDLAAPGVQIIHPDPVSSGGAMWSILAIYGSELKKNGNDAAKALQTLQSIWNNVRSTPDSARAARTQFETGYGDVLITYELEGLLMKQASAPIDIVIPKSTIFSEHPAVAIDRNVTAEERPVVDAFLEYLWTDEAQKAFVKYNFRSITNDAFNADNKEFANIETPFTIELFGGWSRAYPEIIEGVFRDKVQKK